MQGSRIVVGHVPTPAATELVDRIEAEDWDAALQVLDQHWVELWYAIDPADLRQLLSRVPRELLENGSGGYLVGLTGQDQEIDLDRLRAARTRATQLDTVAQRVADLRLAGRPAEAMTLFPEAAASVPALRGRLLDGSGGQVALWLVQAAITALLAGELPTARGLLLEATGTHRPDRFPFVRRDATAKLALAHAVSGNVTEAARWNDRAREMERSASWVEDLVDDSVWLTDYICAVDSLALDRAEEMRTARPSPLHLLEFWGIALQAQVRHLVLTRRSTLAAALCDEVEAAGLPLAGSDGWVATMLSEARWMAGGRRSDRTVGQRVDESALVDVLAQRWGFFATGQFDAAALPTPHESDESGRGLRPQIALRLLRAQSLVGAGRVEEGTSLLQAALTDVFDLGLLSLLRFLAAEGLEAVAETPVGARAAALVEEKALPTVEVVALLESPLTPAELEVLRLMRLGISRQQIAERQFVSLSTVKTQLRTAYRKLGVAKRDDALAVLERLGL